MSAPPQLRLRDPVDIAGITPYLLGFHPTDSLVLLVLADDRVACAMRMDLPQPGSPGEVALAAQVRRFAARNASGGVLLAYGPEVTATDALRLARDVLIRHRLAVAHALRVTAGRIYSVGCPHPSCCPPDGREFDPTASMAAATATVAGLVARPNRDAVAAQVAPVGGTAADAMAAATMRAAQRLGALARPTSAGPPQQALSRANLLCRRGLQLLDAACDTYRRGRIITDGQVAELSILLGVPQVVTDALRRITGDDWQLAMWGDLTRRAQTITAAQPANLLTIAALRAGDGVLAACAQKRAAAADPTDSLAHTLGQAVALGIAPEDVARILAD